MDVVTVERKYIDIALMTGCLALMLLALLWLNRRRELAEVERYRIEI